MFKQTKKNPAGKRKTYPELAPIARRITQLRENAGFTMEGFANEIDLSRTLYASYEKGANITTVNLLKIIKGLGISLREFFNHEDFE